MFILARVLTLIFHYLRKVISASPSQRFDQRSWQKSVPSKGNIALKLPYSTEDKRKCPSRLLRRFYSVRLAHLLLGIVAVFRFRPNESHNRDSS